MKRKGRSKGAKLHVQRRGVTGKSEYITRMHAEVVNGLYIPAILSCRVKVEYDKATNRVSINAD